MKLAAGALTVLMLLWAGTGAVRAEEIPYRVDLTGIEGSGLTSQVERASRLVALKDQPPVSVAGLDRRAEGDIERIRAILRAEGYYDGDIVIKIDDSQQPVAVTIAVTLGAAYTLRSFDVHLNPPAGNPPPEPVPLDRLGIDVGDRARSQPVLTAQDKLIRVLSEQGYPLAKVSDRRVVVDHATTSMRVELEVDTGPPARFGPISVEGLKHLDPAWVTNRIPWQQGERFDSAQLEKLWQKLVSSGLFSSVKLTPAEAVGDDNLLPLTIALTERSRHSVGLGGSWSSTEGFGTQSFWEERDLWGEAEHVRLSVVVSQIRNAVAGDFRAPDFGAVDQDLVATPKAEELRTPAYVTRTLGVQSGLEWLVSPHWKASVAGSVERTFEAQGQQNRSFTLVSLPLELRLDTSDNLLDPTRGNRMVLSERPFIPQLGSTIGFNRIDISDSHYLQVVDEPRTVLAGWGRLGSIQGASSSDIPADKRFFVGGGGSVRPFGYQLAGPLDASNDPIGGGSSLALGGEVRIKVSDTIGVVPFVEGGRAYDTTWPDLRQKLFWGAGLGLRYYTPFGPIRADLAVPFNPRPGIDDPVQVYLSLGQAF